MTDVASAAFGIVCFGAAVVDVRARALTPVRNGTSNPVKSRVTAGGVARNVAECLARLGSRVTLASRVGDDVAGRNLINELDQLGIDTVPVSRSNAFPTATYTALLDQQGALVIGMAEMAIFDEIKPPTLVMPQDPSIRAWLVDTNLPQATLRYLLDHPSRPELVAANCVSVGKARRLDGLLPKIDLLYGHHDELVRLDPSLPGATVITNGGQGALLQEGLTQTTITAFPAAVTDVTGAGDCATGATIWALLNGRSMIEAVRIGQAAAALSLASERAVPETMSPARLHAVLRS